VRSKGETPLVSTCIEAALEEESAILSARERGGGSQYRKIMEKCLKGQPKYPYKQIMAVAAVVGNKC
jgi:hypothetical protein